MEIIPKPLPNYNYPQSKRSSSISPLHDFTINGRTTTSTLQVKFTSRKVQILWTPCYYRSTMTDQTQTHCIYIQMTVQWYDKTFYWSIHNVDMAHISNAELLKLEIAMILRNVSDVKINNIIARPQSTQKMIVAWCNMAKKRMMWPTHHNYRETNSQDMWGIRFLWNLRNIWVTDSKHILNIALAFRMPSPAWWAIDQKPIRAQTITSNSRNKLKPEQSYSGHVHHRPLKENVWWAWAWL